MSSLSDILAAELRNPETSWSMGSYGALAEFFHQPGEASRADRYSRITPLGAIRIERRADIAACATETRGRQQIALCLPAAASRMSAATVLTERGVDDKALRGQDRGALLFDLGVSALGTGCFQVDFCIRTDDPVLIRLCRSHCGCNIFEPGSSVPPALLAAQPERVVITRLGRIEVYQAIGGEHTGGETPEGPHTHLLPELLKSNRTHSADIPVAKGWVPCAFLYPATPVIMDANPAVSQSTSRA